VLAPPPAMPPCLQGPRTRAVASIPPTKAGSDPILLLFPKRRILDCPIVYFGMRFFARGMRLVDRLFDPECSPHFPLDVDCCLATSHGVAAFHGNNIITVPVCYWKNARRL